MSDLTRLCQDLQVGDLATRRQAAAALARLGPEAGEAGILLLQAATDRDDEVREWVVEALENCGPPPADAVDELVGRLQELPDSAYWAATLLGRLEADAAGGVPGLAACLQRSPAAQVRQRCAWALGQIGRSAEAAVAELETAAQADDPRLARLAQRALDAIRS